MACLEEQRDVISGEIVAFFAERAEGALGSLSNLRMQDGVQKRAPLGVPEGQRAELSSIERPVRLQNPGAEGLSELFERRRARKNHLSRERIRAHHRHAALLEEARDGGLSASNTAGQAKNPGTCHLAAPCDEAEFRARPLPVMIRVLFRLIFALAISVSPRSGSAEPTASAEAGRFDLSCVSGGAPLVAPPSFDGSDRFYFATTDAAIHSFEADGRYRFTVTLKALPVGLLVREDGSFFVATADRQLLSFSSEGLLRFSMALLDIPRVGPFVVGPSRIGVLGTRGQLLVFSDNGTRLYTVRVSGAERAPVASGKLLWFETGQSELLVLEGAWRLNTLDAGGRVSLVGPLSGAALALRSTDLLRVTFSEAALLAPNVLFASGSPLGAGLVIEGQGGAQEFVWLDASGKRTRSEPLAGKARLAPAVGPERSWILLEDGRLQSVAAAGEGQLVVGPRDLPLALASGRWTLLGLFDKDRVCVLP